MAIPAWLAGDPRIVAHQHRPRSEGSRAPWPSWLPSDLTASITAGGIAQPWLHQVTLADHAFAGRHVAIGTGTASGKTLGYLMPVMAATAAKEPTVGVATASARRLLTRRRHTALYLAPTKALAHDQYRAAKQLGPSHWRVATLDGDSDTAERTFAREQASYVLTNPDMLHFSVLPNHARWAGLLGSLRYVVIDESHRYRGVFGAHVAQVLRRLRRICASLGADPTFVLASATSTEAGRSGGELIGEEVIEVVDDDTSAHAARDVLLWQPELSMTSEVSTLLARLVDDDRQSIAFVPSRNQAELVARDAQELVLTDRLIASYRAGYLADDRRSIEAGLQHRTVDGVAATNALELGIDVSGMDAVLVAGYPGTLAAMWQQIGRAGRADTDALAVVLARDDPLDGYLFSHPELIFEAPVERTVLFAGNPHILGPHLAAAAQEIPLNEADGRWFGPNFLPVATALADQGVLRRRPQGWFWTRPDRAVDHIDLRSMGGSSIDIVESSTGRVLGQVDPAAADRSVHPGAIHLHQAEPYLVEQYLPHENKVFVRLERAGYYTQPKEVSEVRVLRVDRQADFGEGGVKLHLGEVETTDQVIAFLRRDEITHDVWDQLELDLPARKRRTRSVWWTIPDQLVRRLGFDQRRLASAAHAAEHTAIGLLPLFAPCDRADIGGLSTALHPDTDQCTIFVHDGHPGGAGFADRGFAVAREWLSATLQRLSACACEAGCPSCVVSPKCGNANQFLDKAAARELVAAMLTTTAN